MGELARGLLLSISLVCAKKEDCMSKNIFKDPSPYGTYEGERGNPESWRDAFSEAWDTKKTKEILQEDSPYFILGIEINSSIFEIKKAFRMLMHKYHPDHNGDEGQTRKIMAAYYLIMDSRGKKI